MPQIANVTNVIKSAKLVKIWPLHALPVKKPICLLTQTMNVLHVHKIARLVRMEIVVHPANQNNFLLLMAHVPNAQHLVSMDV